MPHREPTCLVRSSPAYPLADADDFDKPMVRFWLARRQRGALGQVETNGSFSTFWRQRPLRQTKPTEQAWLAVGAAR
jgi:hypothetical protein